MLNEQETQYLSLHGGLFSFQQLVQIFLLKKLQLYLLSLTASTEMS